MLGMSVIAATGRDLLWDGKEDVFKFGSSFKQQTKTISDGELFISAVNDRTNYDYLTVSMQVTPFKFNGRGLSVEFRNERPLEGDAFYVKCLTNDGRIVSSFMTKAVKKNMTEYIMVPEVAGTNGMMICAGQVNAPIDSFVTNVIFFFGRNAKQPEMKVHLKNVALVPSPEFPKTVECVDHGVGIPSAELRHSVAYTDKDGHPYVLCAPLDAGNPYILIIDAITGKTDQYYVPDGVSGAIFGAALTDDGKYVVGLSKNLIFDVNTREYKVAGAGYGSTLSAGFAPDGTIYLGTAPKSVMFSVNPKTGVSRNLGRMDNEEDYLNTIAVDKEGVVYCGIGTARANIVAYNPKTGRRTSLLPAELRAVGSGRVEEGKDGCVYAYFGKFKAKCLGGKVIEENASNPGRVIRKEMHYGTNLSDFGNGMKVSKMDFPSRKMVVSDADGKETEFKIDYVSGGLELTSIALGSDGRPYFSSAHPHHLGRLDLVSGKITDLGYNSIVSGGNFCNMIEYHGKLYACEYAGGRMWEYSFDKPYNVSKCVSSFGENFEKLVARAKCKGGHFTMMGSLNVLFGRLDDGKECTFELPMPAEPGKAFVNIQYYRSTGYGNVTASCKGQERTDNLQGADGAAEIVSIGPIDVAKGEKNVTVKFTVRANDANGSSAFFALKGIEVAKEKRTAVDDAKEKVENPRILGQWAPLVTRPRTIGVVPGGSEVVMGGFAGYGYAGGGLGIYNIATGKTREIKEILPSESCIALDFLPDGTLIGGTSIDAPGGGHTSATQASIFSMDVNTGKVLNYVKVNTTNVIAITYWKKFIYAAASDGQMYVVDPVTFSIIDSFDFSSGGAAVRNAFQKSPDKSKLYLVTNKMVYSVNSKKHDLRGLLMPSLTITNCAGPVIGNRLYFIHNSARVGSVELGK